MATILQMINRLYNAAGNKDLMLHTNLSKRNNISLTTRFDKVNDKSLNSVLYHLIDFYLWFFASACLYPDRGFSINMHNNYHDEFNSQPFIVETMWATVFEFFVLIIDVNF